MKSLFLIERTYDLQKSYSPNRRSSLEAVISKANSLIVEINESYNKQRDETLLETKTLLQSFLKEIKHDIT